MDKSVVSLTRHMQTLWVLRRDSLSLEIQDNIMLIDVNISLHAKIMLFLFKGYLHFTELKKKKISEGSCFMSAAKVQREFSRDNISESEKHTQAPLTLGEKTAISALLIIVK